MDLLSDAGGAAGAGSDFEAADDAQGHNAVVILSHALWQSRFSGNPAVVGTFADIGGVQTRIAGVMPASYDDVLLPGAQL